MDLSDNEDLFMSSYNSYPDNFDDEIAESRREICPGCERPKQKGCICHSFPKEKYRLKFTNIIMIQHKNEQKRPMATEPILRKIVDDSEGAYQLVVCKYFREKQNQELCRRLRENYEDTYVLFPTEKSEDWHIPDDSEACNEAVQEKTTPNTCKRKSRTNLVVIDGTWRQARSIYAKSDLLNSLKTCKISQSRRKKSEYLIRTQPTESSLSTIEAVGLALNYLGEDKSLYESLVRPLRALCQIQLDHGAETHESVQYKIANNLMESERLPQSNNRKKNNMQRLIDDYFENLEGNDGVEKSCPAIGPNNIFFFRATKLCD